MTLRKALMISIAFSVWFAFSPAFGADFIGVPRIVDGDTLAIGSTKIRLEPIDAPETDQVCLNPNGAHWICGIDARDGSIVIPTATSGPRWLRGLARAISRIKKSLVKSLVRLSSLLSGSIKWPNSKSSAVSPSEVLRSGIL
jgi:hypothetical protein